MVRTVLVLLGWVSFNAWASPASTWDDCAATVESLRGDLKEVNRQMRQLETGATDAQTPASLPASAPAEPKSLFDQRLEAHDNWKASKLRLENIERELQKLEDDIQKRKDAGAPDGEIAMIETLARSQRLIVDELKAQLDQIYKKFQELDGQIAAHQQSIEVVQGGLEMANPALRPFLKSMKSHVAASSTGSYTSLLETPPMFTRDLDFGDIFVFPRTELSYDDTTNITGQITVSVEGNLFGLVKGDARGGFVFDTRYSTSANFMAPGMGAVLTRDGAATRDAALFCVTQKTVTYRGFGSVSAGGGLDFAVVKVGVSASLEVGDTVTVGSRRVSGLVQFRQGETFSSKIDECRKFTKQIRDTDALEHEMAGMIQLVPVPESPCYKDYDCRNDVKDNFLKTKVVSACVATKTRERAVCQTQIVDTKDTRCLLPGEEAGWFTKFQCAKGFRCEGKTRRCVAEKTAQDWLTGAGLAEAKAIGLSTHYDQIFDSANKSTGAAFCESQGLPGWVLPTSDQLAATAQWFRAWGRERVRQREPKTAAQTWFYAPDLFTRMLWSDSTAVFLLANDSASRYNPADPQYEVLYKDPDTGRTAKTGVAICVRPLPAK